MPPVELSEAKELSPWWEKRENFIGIGWGAPLEKERTRGRFVSSEVMDRNKTSGNDSAES